MNFLWSLWGKFQDWRFERRCIKYFGCKPEKIYLSPEDFDALQKRISEPPDPKTVESLRKLMNRKSLWDE